MKYKINLLTLKKETLADRFIYFALNYLRYILVITQIVVIIVFFVKFKVDQDIVDLKESVSQKEEIISVSSPLVAEAKSLDHKLKEAKIIIGKQNNLLGEMNYVLSIFPADLFLYTMNIEGTSVVLDGTSQNPNAIKAFYERLQKDNKFKTVTLKNIRKTEAGLRFNLELTEFKN